MKKILSILLLTFLATGFTYAQESTGKFGFTPSSYYTFSWNTAFPMGDFNKWIDQPGPAGFDFGGRYTVRKGLVAGFNLGWVRVAKIYDAQTFEVPEKGIAITARNYRFTWMVPFQAVVAYHLLPERSISPYLGLGIGGDYMEHHLMVQEYDIYKTRWDFSLTPEVGILAKFGAFSQWGALVAFNYKWTTNQIEVYKTASKDLQMLNLKIGLAYIIR